MAQTCWVGKWRLGWNSTSTTSTVRLVETWTRLVLFLLFLFLPFCHLFFFLISSKIKSAFRFVSHLTFYPSFFMTEKLSKNVRKNCHRNCQFLFTFFLLINLILVYLWWWKTSFSLLELQQSHKKRKNIFF